MGKWTGTSRAFAACGKYIQGPGEMKNLGEYTALFGKKVFVLIDGMLYDKIRSMLAECYHNSDAEVYVDRFTGEICNEEIERLENKLQGQGMQVIVGIGGGKTVDTAKVLASDLHTALIVVPTAASTDAPTSALSVIYKRNGEHSHIIFHKKNPDIVLVDSKIIADAPVRLLVSGMGDALATFFEARACKESRTANYVGHGYAPSIAGEAIARRCYETLKSDGAKAKVAAENHLLNDSLERVIEANTLLSGLGFETTGCAAAHGIHDAMTILEETKPYYHGEKVAFGTLCLLFLENRPQKEIDEVYDFCNQVGLPTTLKEIGIEDSSKEHLMPVAKEAMTIDQLQAEPLNVDEEQIYGAMIMADNYGRKRKLQ